MVVSETIVSSHHQFLFSWVVILFLFFLSFLTLSLAAHWTLVELCRGPWEGESRNSHCSHACILPGQAECEGMKINFHGFENLALGLFFSSFFLPCGLLYRIWCLSTTSELCWADSLHGVLILTRMCASLPLTVFTPCCTYSYTMKVLFIVLNLIRFLNG